MEVMEGTGADLRHDTLARTALRNILTGYARSMGGTTTEALLTLGRHVTDYLTTNRANWNARVPIHSDSDFC
jgi:hypothetical protein